MKGIVSKLRGGFLKLKSHVKENKDVRMFTSCLVRSDTSRPAAIKENFYRKFSRFENSRNVEGLSPLRAHIAAMCRVEPKEVVASQTDGGMNRVIDELKAHASRANRYFLSVSAGASRTNVAAGSNHFSAPRALLRSSR